MNSLNLPGLVYLALSGLFLILIIVITLIDKKNKPLRGEAKYITTILLKHKKFYCGYGTCMFSFHQVCKIIKLTSRSLSFEVEHDYTLSVDINDSANNVTYLTLELIEV